MNGNLLTIADLQNEIIKTASKTHKIVSSKSLTLNVPEKSIGFFVVPNTNLAACNNKEKHYNSADETSHHFDSDTPPEVTKIDKEEAIVSAMNELYAMLKEEMSSSEDYCKLDKDDNPPTKIPTDTENISNNVRRIILERAKQLSHEKTEHKSVKYQHLLMERAREEQRKAKLLDEIAKIKASTEVEQAIDDVINHADKIKPRRKRQTTEYLGQEGSNAGHMSPKRTDIDKIEARISLEPVVNARTSGEQSCVCQNTGKCACGLRNTNDIMQGIINMFNKQNIFQRKSSLSNEDKPDAKKVSNKTIKSM